MSTAARDPDARPLALVRGETGSDAPPAPPAPPAEEAALEGAPAESALAGLVPRTAPHLHATYRSVIGRFFGVHRHVLGLLVGARVARADGLPPDQRRRFRSLPLRASAAVLRPLLLRELRHAPFPEQLRRRLELLGPTYVKLGQIMAIREDLLPAPVCRALQVLFDHVPPVPFETVRLTLERELGRPIHQAFRWVDEEPLGSASIAQVHQAETVTGDAVVVKVMKPGIRRSIETDLRLLRWLGALLQHVLPRYQPRRIIDEFGTYTLRELDFTAEADNAETFAANFHDTPEVCFPRIYRELTTPSLLTMELLRGFKPSDPRARALSADDRERLTDLGAGAIIRMLYRDGFFHADLHPANLLILGRETVRAAGAGVGGGGAWGAAGSAAAASKAAHAADHSDRDTLRVGFVDLGMVGRFEDRMRRRMLYYYHALVTRDVEGAAKFLGQMAELGRGADPVAFRRAVVDLSRRFVTRAERGEFSIAQLILESIGLGARYRVYFPVEMTLMVKALVTFEGVGRMLDPHLDVTAISRRHVSRILQRQFTLERVSREVLREAPELIELAVGLPQLLVSGSRFLEESFDRRPPRDPATGLRSAVLAGACLIGGVLTLTAAGPPALWIPLFGLAAVMAVWRG